MAEVYEIIPGRAPILLSIPHSGTAIPAEISKHFTTEALRLEDTDWFIPELYAFAPDMDVTVVKANYSRLLIDLNRPPDNADLYPGALATGLCPLSSFAGKGIYLHDQCPIDDDITRRRQCYWQPYHSALQQEAARLKALHGYCILYDAHSIRSTVPLLFAGSLPDLNLGTFNGASCSGDLQTLVEQYLRNAPVFTWTVNGRFTGGYITRHFGSPGDNIHALQMEIAQCAYMDEMHAPRYDPDRSRCLRDVLHKLFENLIHWQPDAP